MKTWDQFRADFRDAMAEGRPLGKCIEMGVISGDGVRRGKLKFSGDAQTFLDAVRKGNKDGMKAKDAIANALDLGRVGKKRGKFGY